MARREHRRFERRFAAGVAAVMLLAGIGLYALVQRVDAVAPKRSQAGDACPVRSHTRNGDMALDGVVAFDRTSGKVLWTNVAPNGSQLGHRRDDLVIIRADDRSERVVNPATGAVTSCGGQSDDVVVDDAGAGRFEPGDGAILDLGSLRIEAAGDGADVRALASDGDELWATDGGNPAVGGRATVESPIHAAALTSDGRTVVVLTSATLNDPD
jgi:hypothetical protein